MNTPTLKPYSGKAMLGYGVAGVGNAIGAGLFYVYFIFFMTNVAGVRPAVAGSVSMIAVLWDAINDPMIGYWSDTCKSKFGRRRPFMISGMIPLSIVLVLMFTNFDMAPSAKAIYFIVLNILFWFFFTWTDVPTIALGDAINTNYDNKTKCRTAWTVFMMLGSIFGESLPAWITGTLEEKYGDASKAWFMMIIVLALMTFLAYFISWNATRGLEVIPKAAEQGGEKFHFVQGYKQAFANKGMRYSMPGVMFVYMGFNGAAIPAMTYICTYNLGLSDAKVSAYIFVYTGACIIGAFVLGAISSKYDRKLGGKSKEIAYAFGIYAVASILCYFIGARHWTVILCLFLLGFTCNAFFLHGWNLALDAAKIDYYKTGEEKGGVFTALIGFFFKIGGAIGMWLVGIFLELFGFDAEAEEQSANALNGISLTFFLITGITLLIGCIILYKNPMTRKKMDALLEAIDNKEKGLPVDESGFADLL